MFIGSHTTKYDLWRGVLRGQWTSARGQPRVSQGLKWLPADLKKTSCRTGWWWERGRQKMAHGWPRLATRLHCRLVHDRRRSRRKPVFIPQGGNLQRSHLYFSWRTRKPGRSTVWRVLWRADVDILEYTLSNRKLPLPVRRTELSALHQRPACYK